MVNLVRVSLLLVLCSTAIVFSLVQAKTTVVGVSQGDIFEYDMVAYWSSLYTDTVPPSLLEINQTQWIRVTVTSVSGSKINTQVTEHYRNGTERNLSGFCDIDTGENTGGPPFISANLGKNDLVNPSASEPWRINATLTRTYKDGTRETNYLKLEYVENDSSVGEFSRTYEYYFDKSTGVLVEYIGQVSYTGVTSITHSKLISSSVWTIPEFPSFFILLLLAAIMLFAIVAKKRLFTCLL